MDTIKKPRQSSKDPWLGKTITEKYLLEKLIGSGGMGSVYAGKHIDLGRSVAIKVMNSDIVTDKTAEARFIREAKTAAKLDHPNAVTIHDFGTIEGGGAFIVMEYISGQTLRKYLAQNGPLSLEQALEWFTPICEVIETAHQRGIIHRDLKPENIMLKVVGDDIVIKVVDFGLAKLVSGEEVSQKLTKTGEFMGTPQYMAPEVYDGENADSRADIYALGIILYEMITGKVPFSGSVQNIISGHLFKEPTSVTEIKPNLPQELDEVLKLALEKKRDERVSSAIAFANAFKQAVEHNARMQKNVSDNFTETKKIDTAKIEIAQTPQVKQEFPTLKDAPTQAAIAQDSFEKKSKKQTENIAVSSPAKLVQSNDVTSDSSENTSLFKQKPVLLLAIVVAFLIFLAFVFYYIFSFTRQSSLHNLPENNLSPTNIQTPYSKTENTPSKNNKSSAKMDRTTTATPISGTGIEKIVEKESKKK
jgi:serine/threonine protein kinase